YASGKSYDENARELFFKAGISNTYTAEHFTGKNLASAHTGTAKNATPIENMPLRLSNPSISTPAGGILSTVSDLHCWNLALYSGKLLQPNSLKKFLAKTSVMKHPVIGPVDYGYGIMVGARPTTYLQRIYLVGAPALLIDYPFANAPVVSVSNIADSSKRKHNIFLPHAEVQKVPDVHENAAILLKTPRKQ